MDGLPDTQNSACFDESLIFWLTQQCQQKIHVESAQDPPPGMRGGGFSRNYRVREGGRRFSEACSEITVRDMIKRTAEMGLEGHIYPINQVSAFSCDNIEAKRGGGDNGTKKLLKRYGRSFWRFYFFHSTLSAASILMKPGRNLLYNVFNVCRKFGKER